eukprot:scaffold13722_cov55-Phaeocystis_antarctica.AAC.4
MHIDDPIAYGLWKLMMARGADTSTTHGATVRTSVSFSLYFVCDRLPYSVRAFAWVGVAWPPFGTLHPSPFCPARQFI